MSRRPPSRSDLPQARLRSFDGAVVRQTRLVKPGTEKELADLVARFPALVGRGQGLSYAAASFSAAGVSVEMTELNAIIDFDSETGDVIVEAGVKLGDLFDFLEARGRYLPVQPGHSDISIGGCVAADVHGKNQARDGNFHEQVRGLTLHHPAHGSVEIDGGKERALFDATCGGYGLTGIITRVTLKTQALPGHGIRLTTAMVESPEHGARIMEAESKTSVAVYSWHDFMHRAGVGFVVSGQFDTEAPPARHMRPARALSADWRSIIPFALQNRLTARLINTLYCRLNKPGSRYVDLRQAFFPAAGKEIYFALFGARGFHEYQVIVPIASFPAFIDELRAGAKHYNVPLVLASGKIFSGKSELLRFDGGGVCFAVNLPRSANSLRFMAAVDEIAIRLGCRPNIIKDSRLPRAVVEACYPEYDRFRRLLRDWDPARQFRSELSERLGL